MDRRILFIDMNSFFASVEQQANPKLRGRPVGVSPIDAPSGCIIAASYEAKRLGVNVGHRVKDARSICPEIHIVVSTPDKYLSVHAELVKILNNYSPSPVMLSVDEAFFELDKDTSSAKAQAIAFSLKKDIARLGEWLKCSIGVAPNLFLAKAAAESHKPDGYTELLLKDLPAFFGSIPSLMEIKGIKKGMARRLWAMGINSSLELFEAPPSNLRASLGIVGEYWYLKLHGYRINELEHPTKSIGNQHVLAPEFRTPTKTVAILRKLTERACKRLRAENLWATGAAVFVYYLNGASWHKTCRAPMFKDSFSFWEYIKRLYDSRPYHNETIMMVGVTALGLVSSAEQLMLFPFDEAKRLLNDVMDKINDRHGQGALKSASILGVENAAPKRISFGRIR